MDSYVVRDNQQAQAARVDQSWGSLLWLVGKAQGNSDGLTLGRVVIKAGCANPAHLHETCEEALYLLAGRLRHYIGEGSVILVAGDTLTVPAGLPHYAESLGPDDADMIVAYDTNERDFRKV